MIAYRLALDIGTNSIGWCVLALDNTRQMTPASVIDTGVRIFSDGRNPKDGASNAVTRRQARSMRRNRDRFIERRNRLIKTLVAHGLMPEDGRQRRVLAELDPYELRARGVHERLSLHEFGRALFHLNQRRGFKSSRKGSSGDKESGPIKEAIRAQHDKIGDSTFGEYLYHRRQEGFSIRARLAKRRVVDEKGRERAQEYYDFFPAREVLVEEFNILWKTQAGYYPAQLTKLAHDQLENIIFFQRPLKPPVVGRCTFEQGENRAPKALPVVQRFRIYQEVNNLQVIEPRTLKGRPLFPHERDRLVSLMCRPTAKKNVKTIKEGELTFDKMRGELGLGPDHTFSHESDKRHGLDTDTTSAMLCHKERFGARWYELSAEEQEEIVLALLDVDDEDSLVCWLMEGWQLDREHAEAVINTPLVDGYGRLGITATRRILEQLMTDVIPYSEAARRAGYAHSEFDTGKRHDRLPYYGEVLERHLIPDPQEGGSPEAPLEKRYGKVNNPTVHIALNQLRRVVNEIIKLYGAPAEIHVEVLRDLKNSVKQKKEIETEQKKNQDENEKCAAQLRNEFNQAVNRENIQRLRLWNALPADNRVCPYTGENISAGILFSPKIEIDHILPFSRTLDDSMANKILCTQRANREKSNQTPHEAWSHDSEQWQAILDRIAILPKNKRQRFAEDAMERYMADRDFIARQLTDSQYITRLAREYLAVLFEPRESKVVCLPGRLTAMFRHHLGMDSILDEINPSRVQSNARRGEKNRDDHRHHAVDALVVGLIDRSFLQRAATIHARSEQEGIYSFLSDFAEPWPDFRASVREALAKIIVSHKPDHGIEDALHNDTAYGFARKEDPRGNAIHYVFIDAIDMKKLLNIKSKHLRAELVAHLTALSHNAVFQRLEAIDAGTGALDDLLANHEMSEKEIKARIQDFFMQRGIRRVRLIERIDLIPMRRRGEKSAPPYKGFKPGGNAYMTVFQISGQSVWKEEVVTLFDANSRRKGKNSTAIDTSPDTRRIATLFNLDMVEIEQGDSRRVFYIQKMVRDGRIYIAEHFEANTDSRNSDKENPFKFIVKTNADALRRAKARFLVVTPAGKIRYLSDDPDAIAST